MHRWRGEQGLTVVDVLTVLALVALLVFVATQEFPRYQQPDSAPPIAAG